MVRNSVLMSNMTQNRMYNLLLQNASSIQYSQQVLTTIKKNFESEIASPRRMSYIDSLEALIKILEKRDALSPYNLKPLMKIAIILNNNEMLSLIRQFEASPLNSREDDSEIRVLPKVPRDPKQRVYTLIADEMGQKWQDFARALEIRESQIDALIDKHRQIRDRVFEILKYHEESCDNRYWKTKLLEALSTARRNDLKLRVQEIFDNHCL